MSQNYDELIATETAEETAARENRLRAGEIARRFKEIDAERIRPLSAIALGTATTYDTDKLTTLETEAAALRTELAGLGV